MNPNEKEDPSHHRKRSQTLISPLSFERIALQSTGRLLKDEMSKLVHSYLSVEEKSVQVLFRNTGSPVPYR